MINSIKRILMTKLMKKRNFLTQQVEYMGMVAESQVIYPYGMKSSAPVDTPGVALLIGCQENNKVVIPYEFTKISKLPVVSDGDVVLGSPESGSYIIFKKDGTIEISGTSINVKGPVNFEDDITAPNAFINNVNFNVHVHVKSGAGPVTGPPENPP